MKNLNTVASGAVIGILAGLITAHFFPSLGKSGLDKGLTDFAVSLGGQKPYLVDGAIGGGIGALLGAFLFKK